MDQNKEILDNEFSVPDNSKEEEFLISENKFMFLCFISLGMYQVWWKYKAWKFFKERENLDIIPAARAIFTIFFLHGLLNRILGYASSKGYAKDFSVTGMYLGYIVSSMCSRLPEPYYLIGLMNFTFLLPAFRAFNYAKENSSEIKVTHLDYFTGRQITLIVVGTLLWLLILTGMFDPAMRTTL
ncbi:MAG: hypothetical protein ACO1G9_11815 [Bacteroidota bacterium]